MAASSSGRAPITGINVTPLVDVVLVLLVVLMVTATEVARRSVPLELPRAVTGAASTGPLRVDVDASGAMFVDGEPVDTEGLARAARQAMTADPSARAVLAADGRAEHRAVVTVIDVLRQEGIVRYALVVDRPAEQ